MARAQPTPWSVCFRAADRPQLISIAECALPGAALASCILTYSSGWMAWFGAAFTFVGVACIAAWAKSFFERNHTSLIGLDIRSDRILGLPERAVPLQEYRVEHVVRHIAGLTLYLAPSASCEPKHKVIGFQVWRDSLTKDDFRRVCIMLERHRRGLA
jgi:hypothetical protein